VRRCLGKARRGHFARPAAFVGRRLTSFHLQRTLEEREYVRRSTVFVLAEYLGWVEILRRDAVRGGREG
jgi:hypothetical protein